MANNQPKKEWKTFQKQKETKKITNRKSTNDEIKISKMRTKEFHYKHPKHKFRNGRQLSGNNFEKYTDLNRPLEIINKIDEKWEEKTAKNLMRFIPKETKLMLKHEKSFTFVLSENRGKYFEQVVVSYLKDGITVGGYRAMVDPQTGKITKTWDRIHKDNFKREHFSFSQHQD